MALPETVLPMLATAGSVPAEGHAFEFKWDGVRAVVGVADGEVRAHSRTGVEITVKYPELTALADLVDAPVLLDGELVALDERGRPDFALLQERMHARQPSERLLTGIPVQFYVFDLLSHDGHDVMSLPYWQRRERLAELGLEAPPRIRVPRHYTDVDGEDLLDVAREHGLEGIVAKRVDSRYHPGARSRSWVKTAVVSTQEVILCGWTTGRGRRAATFGSLLLGIHTRDGLVYCGHVGTGFTDAMVRELRQRLDGLARDTSPFDSEVPDEHARHAHWVEPVLVGEVEYRQWTIDGRLRAASWRGLREDKDPRDVGPAAESAGDSARAGRLARYRQMRDFSRTAEPAGDDATPVGERFVVQRHRARRRHYDLRLELGGVLVSWAVPKGPTLDPSVRRMAVHVEDHPVEYADFEGVIPAGEYGGGDVIVWDRGSWQPVDTDDPHRAIEDGNLHFDLYGRKLAGRFVLIRPKRADSGQEQWLLLKKQTDEHAQPGWDPEDHPKSVKSGRTNEEVAADPEAMWHGDRPPSEAEVRTGPRWRPPTDDELAALDELGGDGTWRIDGRQVPLTNLDKVLFPGRDGEPPVTKRELIRYHARIAPVMLPYLADRPLNANRFPNGVDKPGFWHKRVPEHAPDWLRRWHNPDADSGETQYYFVPDSVAAMVWLANYGALELHAWTSRVADVNRPTWALFDIDPGPETSFEDVLQLARLHRTALEHLGIEGRPKITGQRGIQIWVPVAPRYTFEDTRGWAETVSRAIGRTVPDLVSWAWTKKDRRGLARLDYTQNVRNKTLVAPYSARPRPGAPVSVPLEWDELDDPELTPDRWTIRTVPERVATAGDPFAALVDLEQELPAF